MKEIVRKAVDHLKDGGSLVEALSIVEESGGEYWGDSAAEWDESYGDRELSQVWVSVLGFPRPWVQISVSRKKVEGEEYNPGATIHWVIAPVDIAFGAVEILSEGVNEMVRTEEMREYA